MGFEFVRRCKKPPLSRWDSISNLERFKTLHVSENGVTLCGENLDEMWFVEDPKLLSLDMVTCKKCRNKIKGE